MKIIVDTSIWSLVLRKGADQRHVSVLGDLSRRGQVQMLGAIRQEVLSGIREARQFQYIRDRLAAFPDLAPDQEDYESAATLFNRCRSRGVQGSHTDLLICAVAIRHDFLVYSTDADFKLYAKHVHVKMYTFH